MNTPCAGQGGTALEAEHHDYVGSGCKGVSNGAAAFPLIAGIPASWEGAVSNLAEGRCGGSHHP